MSGRMHGLLTALVLCYFTISGIAGKASSCIPEERDALLSFKAGVADPGDKLGSWQGQDCCKWSGVACSNKTLHVIKLDVGQYGLKGEGEINSSLAALTRLAYLNLSDNNFGGLAIPEFLGSFKKLRYLDLSRSYFGGKVPPHLGNLSTLEHLDLNSFNSSPTIRVDSFLWVSCLMSLTYLDLGWVSLAASSDWLQALSKLPLLEDLHLNDAFLPATDFDSVSYINFTALKVLDLKSNEMNSSLLNWICRLHSLSYLDLSSCQLSGSIPAKIGNLTSLKFLLLSDNHLTGDIPQDMDRLCILNHIDLSMNNLVGDFEVVEKNIFHCMKQLRTLDVHSNNLTGSLSGWLEDLTSVAYLDISKNFFYRQVPENLGKLSSLTHLDLSSNALEGMLSEIHFEKLSRLDFLNLGSNNLKVPPFQLKGLGLHACRVGPYFPTWLRTQTKIEMVDLGGTEIMSTLPDWLWNFSSSITILDLSNNNITGRLPSSLVQMKMLRMFNVRSNLLVGRIPNLPASIEVLDLSLNLLSGPLPESLGAVEIYSMILSYNNLSGIIPSYLCSMPVMEVISLSYNSFSGVLPDCWQNISRLQTIDFSSNKLYGEIPSTMGSITSLAILILRENRLSGKLPASLQSCNGLIILDLGYNNLSGGMPTWNSQQSLFMLSLRSNQFSGEIPEQLSQLRSLQILDLSDNNLCGPVPGSQLSQLRSLQILDLSDNNLWGPVPGSLGNLTAMQSNQGGFQAYAAKFPEVEFTTVFVDGKARLAVFIGAKPLFVSYYACSLNLSLNQLTGEIPEEIGNLWNLEALGLSQNRLSGPIPSSMANLSFLSLLNLSYNNLSGKIPTGPQLETFDPFIYAGNADLCGPPLSTECSQGNPFVSKHRHKNDRGAYICAMLGFAYGLSVVSAILLFSATARKAYFEFTDSKLEEFQTVVEIKLNRFKAGRCQSMEARRVSNHNSITCYDYELEFGSPAPGDSK